MKDEETQTPLVPSQDSVPTLAAGTVVAEKYKVVSVLGSGGMSAVYLVHQILLGKDFALKVLDTSRQSEVGVRRFQQEAQMAAQLRHSSLVEVIDFGMLSQTEPYLVMDYIDGPTLAQLLKSRGKLRTADVVALAIQIGFGLMYAHEKGVVHRDIKPGNIMLLQTTQKIQEGSVKIVDFGIAKLMQSEDGEIQQLTKTGEIFGSPIYMSPEQCKGVGVDHRTDIYSLGCVIFECLTGVPPFVGDTAMSTMVMRLTQDPPTLHEASGGMDFPEQLQTIVNRMLKAEVGQRYQTVAELVRDLMNIQHSTSAENLRIVRAKRSKGAAKKQFSHGRQISLVISSVLLSSIATLILDRLLWSKNLLPFRATQASPAPYAVAPSGTSPPLKKFPLSEPSVTGSVIVPALHAPVCKTEGGETIVQFFSDCGQFTVGASSPQPARDHIFRVPKGVGVSLDLSAQAADTPQVLNNLASLNFDLITVHDRVTTSNESLVPLKNFQHIKKLDIDGCPIDSLQPIYDLRLQSLNIVKCDVTADEILKLKHLNELAELDFGPVKSPNKVLSKLIGSDAIKTMQYRGVTSDYQGPERCLNIEDADLISKISSLEHLDLRINSTFNDRCLVKLESLKHLQSLALDDCD